MAGKTPPPPAGTDAHEDDAALAKFLQRKQEERIKMPFAPAIEDRLQVLKPNYERTWRRSYARRQTAPATSISLVQRTATSSSS